MHCRYFQGHCKLLWCGILYLDPWIHPIGRIHHLSNFISHLHHKFPTLHTLLYSFFSTCYNKQSFSKFFNKYKTLAMGLVISYNGRCALYLSDARRISINIWTIPKLLIFLTMFQKHQLLSRFICFIFSTLTVITLIPDYEIFDWNYTVFMKYMEDVTARVFLLNESRSVPFLVYSTFVLYVYENILYIYIDLLFVLTTIFFFQLVREFTSRLDKTLPNDVVSFYTNFLELYVLLR